MLVSTLRIGDSAVVRDIRVVIVNCRGNRVTLGFEISDGVKASDMVEIELGAGERELILTRNAKSA